MSGQRDPDAIENEPALGGAPADHGDSNRLEDEPVRADAVDDEPLEHSVADEPALGWRPVVARDVPGYADLLEARMASTGAGPRLLAWLLVAAVAGPLAVVGALVEGVAHLNRPALLAFVVFGPVVEEMLKIGLLLWLVERRPWLVWGVAGIVSAAAASGAGFAAVENLLYLHVSVPDADAALVRWRWTVCLGMHFGCTLIASIGIVRMWRSVIAERRPARTAIAYPWLVAAMVVHGLYNLATIGGGALESGGDPFRALMP